MDGGAEAAIALPAGQAVRLVGLRGNDVADGFSLDQVHLAVQKGALSEFAGFGEARAAMEQAT